ncbi:MAG: hypothetical protein NNA18_11740 [Nitrospira sp.]|nr:hypothetical protein [Nitrospira sp.]
MNQHDSTTWMTLCVVVMGFVISACQSQHALTQTIYESPSRFVRLEADHTVGGGHSHPADVTTAEVAAVLGGIIINEPVKLIPSLPFFGKDEEPPRHPAFTTAEIGFFAPLLTQGLKMATPDQVVTFYQSVQQTAVIRRVTSGGVFLDGDELHIIVSNYRSPTHYSSDPGTADTHDDRLMPLRSITPLQPKLDFEPATALVPPQVGTFFSRLFRPDRPELIVRLSQVRAGLPEKSHPPAHTSQPPAGKP